MRSNCSQRGFSLVEVIVFIVIVSVGLTGVMTSLNISVRSSADPLQPKQALAIAEAFMEEVSFKAYTDPGIVTCTPTPVGSRSCYDSLDDYASFDQPNASSIDGALTFTGYRVQVGVGSPAPLNGVTMRQITVIVTPPSGSAITLVGYRANY